MRVGLVGCVKTKAAHPAPAKDLYVSALFRGRRSYVEASCDTWFILSARYGVVTPGDVIEPYDATLKDQPAHVRRAWSASVVAQLDKLIDVAGAVVEIHAGAEYRNFGLVDGLTRRGAVVEIPCEHLSQGEQLSFYATLRPRQSEVRPPTAREAAVASAPRGSYAPLGEHLRAVDRAVEELTFAGVERILARALPASARRHRAWWANESGGTHSHARSWLAAGWLVDAVDLNSQVVRFRRVRR